MASNLKDTDYLELRKHDNVRFFATVQQILEEHSEGNQQAVFSEIVHMYNPDMSVREMIIMITQNSIYMLDSRAELKSQYSIGDLSEFILVKANPSIFAMSFTNGKAPLILRSIRRAELMLFVMQPRQQSLMKPKVVKGDTIKILMTSRKTKLLELDKAPNIVGPRISPDDFSLADQSNVFANAMAKGHMDKMSKGLLKKKANWKNKFVVLSNIGLLYFESVTEAPKGFIPIVDSTQLVEVNPEEVAGDKTVFRLTHAQKQLTLRCRSLTEYRIWMKAIRALQKETVTK